MEKFAILLTVMLSICCSAECSSILVYICEVAKSHHLMYHPIIRALATRGHQVDYYTHHPMTNSPKNLNQIVLPSDGMEELFSTIETSITELSASLPSSTVDFNRLKFHPWYARCYESTILKDLLSSNKTYDAVIGEFYFVQEDYSILLHRFSALGIGLASLQGYYWVNELSGLPFNPSYMVHYGATNSDRMTFFERLYNFYEITISTWIDYYYLTGPFQQIADKYMKYDGWESRPSIAKLVSNMALILVGTHHSLDYLSPKAPHFKEIMGTNIDENPTPLTEDLKNFMDNAENGVVYFSLGTLASNTALKRSGAYEPLIKVLSNLKQRVVWKWTSRTNEEPPKIPNIKFIKWVPQQSVLAHNKTKLFITHGGLGSLTEAVHHGVKMIGLPVFGDQLKNTLLLTRLGLGSYMKLKDVTEKSLAESIDDVLNNPRYSEEMKKRSAMFRDRPMKPVDEAVYWIEYVLRFGNVLQPAAATMPFYQLYLLDVIGFIIICAVLAIFAFICLARLGLKKMQEFCFSSKPYHKRFTKKNK